MTADSDIDPLDRQSSGAPLRIVRVVPPEPHYSPGTYEVRLELSRPLTSYERRVLPTLGRRMHAVGRVLTIGDTTLERVAQEAGCLAQLVDRLEQEGTRLEHETEQRTRVFAARLEEERRRLSELASAIRFPEVGSSPTVAGVSRERP
jgi:hypothetical protein